MPPRQVARCRAPWNDVPDIVFLICTVVTIAGICRPQASPEPAVHPYRRNVRPLSDSPSSPIESIVVCPHHRAPESLWELVLTTTPVVLPCAPVCIGRSLWMRPPARGCVPLASRSCAAAPVASLARARPPPLLLAVASRCCLAAGTHALLLLKLAAATFATAQPSLLLKPAIAY